MYELISGLDPSEPSLNVNTYLEPLVKDLLAFLKGVLLNATNCSKESFRVALVFYVIFLLVGKFVAFVP